jgi:hypothetical protein
MRIQTKAPYLKDDMKTTDRLCYAIFKSGRNKVGPTVESLTKDERELLVKSLPSGSFVVFESEHYGDHVASGETHWFSHDDQTCRHRMLEAFESLCHQGFIRHTTLRMFKLSRMGFEMAHSITDEQTQANVA